MGVGVKIVLGTLPGLIETVNLVISGNYSVTPINADLDNAPTTNITVTNLSGSTTALIYQYRG